jgi:3-isopropylmalate/(R)-2-methylmalate dehydratase small subunit
MEPFTTLSAIACPLGLADVDTDQLIPARFMVRSRADGYGGYLFHDLRFDADGQMRPGFVLDQPRYGGAKVLVARRNFGCGSSREAAVYALWDFGVRCVIAPAFGDIFASNATKNGLLVATVSEAEVEALLATLTEVDKPEIRVDLEQATLTLDTQSIVFTIDPARRLQLLNGWDDIDLTLHHRAEIHVFKTTLKAQQPWAIKPPA